MCKKDAVEKTFFDLDDVFADIVNVFIAEGKYTVLPEDLETVHPSSVFTDPEGNIRWQNRDVCKIVKGREMVNLALVGLEPQSCYDEDMPLRVYSYNGAGYYYQAKRRKEARDNTQPVPPVYPVITLILNFTGRKWDRHTTLQSCFKDDPAGINHLAGDLELHIIDIPEIPKEKKEQLKSDFKYLVEFYQGISFSYEDIEGIGDIVHIEEFAKLMAVLMEDSDIERTILDIYNNRGGTHMHEVYRKFQEHFYGKGKEEGLSQGREEGLSQGREEGLEEGVLSSVMNLMKNTGIDAEHAMEILEVPEEKRNEYALRIKEKQS